MTGSGGARTAGEPLDAGGTSGAGGPVAIQGVAGAFSHLAARRVYGNDVTIHPCATFDDLFQAVAEGTAEAGVVPVENSLAGAVQRPLDLLLSSDIRAVAETSVAVRLCLVGPPGSSLEEVRSAASHPVALEQCHGFFRAHRWIERHTAWDTAGSVRDAVAGTGDYDAGVGSELAAEVYGGVVLARDIQDHRTNRTRFLAVLRGDAVGSADTSRPGHPPRDKGSSAAALLKTSIVLTTAHRPGALHAVLGVLANAGLDLTRLESRPIPDRPWEYRFHVDVRGGTAEEQDYALDAIRALGADIVTIGRYPEEARASFRPGSPSAPPASPSASAGIDSPGRRR